MIQFVWEHLALIGFASLIIIFLASFFFRTAWGHWHKGKGRRYKRPASRERAGLRCLYSEKKKRPDEDE